MRDEEILSKIRSLDEKLATLEYHVSRLEGDLHRLKNEQASQRRW